MSVHPSLRSVDKAKSQRSVLKRIEKIKHLIKKGLWQEGDSILGLPKIKTVRIKIKKEKAAKEATPEASAAAAGETKPSEEAPDSKSSTSKGPAKKA